MKDYLDECSKCYYAGFPLISNEAFDYLADRYNYTDLGTPIVINKAKHYNRMYSLQKVFDNDKAPLDNVELIKSPKLDGAALSLLYVGGNLVQATTRGDGIEGEDVTDKFLNTDIVPSSIPNTYPTQITGELLTTNDKPNFRNYAAGALNLKDVEEFTKRDLWFVAYDTSLQAFDYKTKLNLLSLAGFTTVLDKLNPLLPTDGQVYRINDTEAYELLGYTAKYPRGAYAHKIRANIAVEETTLLDVVWQVGKGGKVTPVGIFEEVVIDGAKITRASLKNVGILETLDLAIGDRILVTRAGHIIPEIIGKA